MRSCHGDKEYSAVDATGGQEEASTGSAARKLVAVTGGRAGIAHLADAPRPGWELSRQWSVLSSHTCPIHRQLRSASVDAGRLQALLVQCERDMGWNALHVAAAGGERCV